MERGERVKAIRKARGLTLEDFSAKLGVGKSSVSKIEKGTRNLTEQMLQSICREYGVNEAWLRSEEGEMFLYTPEEHIAALGRELGLDDDTVRFLIRYSELPPMAQQIVGAAVKTALGE